MVAPHDPWVEKGACASVDAENAPGDDDEYDDQRDLLEVRGFRDDDDPVYGRKFGVEPKAFKSIALSILFLALGAIAFRSLEVEISIKHVTKPNDTASVLGDLSSEDRQPIGPDDYYKGESNFEDQPLAPENTFDGYDSHGTFDETSSPPQQDSPSTIENETLAPQDDREMIRHVNVPAPRVQPLVAVVYHKTGHSYLKKLLPFLDSGKEPRFQKRLIKLAPSRDDLNERVGSFSPKEVAVIAATPEMKPGTPTKNVTLLHFVRNPFRMAISSFLYSRQPVAPEAWLTTTHVPGNREKKNYFCIQRPGAEEYETMRRENLGISKSEWDAVRSLCLKLFPDESVKTYHKRLRELDEHTGLRLEAARIFLQDISRMGSHSKYLHQYWPYYLQSCMDNTNLYPGKALEEIGKAFGKTFSKGTLALFSQKEKHEQERFKERAREHKVVHVTTSLAGEKKVKEWVELLRVDPVLGPVLSRVEQVVGCEAFP